MKRTLLIILCFLCGCSTVKNITFTSITRGSRKEILVTSKGIKLVEQKLGNEEKSTMYPIATEDWDKLISILKTINRREIDGLESPTNKRQYDGAMASTITIKYKGKTYQHGFDDVDPHEKLKPLLNEIYRITPQ
jgi:hypothetical protein